MIPYINIIILQYKSNSLVSDLTFLVFLYLVLDKQFWLLLRTNTKNFLALNSCDYPTSLNESNNVKLFLLVLFYYFNSKIRKLYCGNFMSF